jgi:hypothetical protein
MVPMMTPPMQEAQVPRVVPAALAGQSGEKIMR